MSDNKLDFSKARHQDVLWSDKHGEVTFLDHIVSDSVYPLRARDSCGTVRRWNWMGFLPGRHRSNDLHWSRPQFEEPPPPKRLVKRWVVLLWSASERRLYLAGREMYPTLYSTLKEAEGYGARATAIAEVEVEEWMAAAQST